jgi:tetratricopeptide (TPR) repeat protein
MYQSRSMLRKFVSIVLVFIYSILSAKAQDPLDQYIKRLRQSEATGGSETGFLSVGSTFLYGQGYFDKKEYNLANMYFMQAYQKDSTNAFVNYQIAASLLKQNDKYKAIEAEKYFQNALRLNPELKKTFEKDFPTQKQANTNTKSTTQGLAKYIDDLMYSRSTGGAKTAMNAPGLDVLYGYEYYQKGTHDLAAMRFRQAVAKDPEDIYANYLLGVSLTAQGSKAEAIKYLDKAFAGDAGLRKQFTTDAAKEIAAYKKIKDAKENSPSPANKAVYGGKLVYGNYTCTETVWNGPNAAQPYSFPRKGYFELKSDGTYRWLDNGSTGKYSYNEKTGEVKWLSGHLANMQAKTSQYQGNKQVPQITVNFSANYRWECGCDKK